MAEPTDPGPNEWRRGFLTALGICAVLFAWHLLSMGSSAPCTP